VVEQGYHGVRRVVGLERHEQVARVGITVNETADEKGN
jgi:hypothetical protein